MGIVKTQIADRTLLVMALHALCLRVSGESAYMSPGVVVDMACRSMVTDPGNDGVDSRGGRADEEHNTYTNFDELMRGDQAAGARGAVYLRT